MSTEVVKQRDRLKQTKHKWPRAEVFLLYALTRLRSCMERPLAYIAFAIIKGSFI